MKELKDWDLSIPEIVITDKTLSANATRLYLIIAKSAKRDGYSSMLNPHLGDLMNMSYRSIASPLKELIDRDLIMRVENVKPSKIYRSKHKRVLWIQERYDVRYARLRREEERMARKELSIGQFVKMKRKAHQESKHPLPVFVGEDYQLIINDRGRMVNALRNFMEVSKDVEETAWASYHGQVIARKITK